METLKKLEEVYQPDERNLKRYDLNHSTGIVTPTGVASIYTIVESIRLNDNVPDEIRSHFEVAKNLALYSWFVYSFSEVAAMQALASLEMAARAKTGDDQTAFKNLLDKLFKGRNLMPEVSLAKVLASHRNKLAHGSTMISGQGFGFVGGCAELINELYPS
jgi:hypothetical protein